MGLSRKREKELKRLRGNAGNVWAEQQEVLEHASAVIKEASRQATKLAGEEVTPRVRDVVDTKIKPTVDHGYKVASGTVRSAKDRFVDDVLPSVAAVIGSSLSIIDTARDPKLRHKLGEVTKDSWAAISKPVEKVVVPQKKKSGVGTFFAVGAAVVAVAGIGYAVWQTFRADDELWVADDEPVPGTDTK